MTDYTNTDDNVIDLRDRRPLVDIKTVAAYLGVTVRHVRRLVDERRIPFIKWGHLLRFDLNEIDAWIDANRYQPLRPA
jgi:excisionase family DNA binding protein